MSQLVLELALELVLEPELGGNSLDIDLGNPMGTGEPVMVHLMAHIVVVAVGAERLEPVLAAVVLGVVNTDDLHQPKQPQQLPDIQKLLSAH